MVWRGRKALPPQAAFRRSWGNTVVSFEDLIRVNDVAGERGTPNKNTALMKVAFAAAASDVGLTPLEFMLGIMKDTTVLPQLRLKAA